MAASSNNPSGVKDKDFSLFRISENLIKSGRDSNCIENRRSSEITQVLNLNGNSGNVQVKDKNNSTRKVKKGLVLSATMRTVA